MPEWTGKTDAEIHAELGNITSGPHHHHFCHIEMTKAVCCRCGERAGGGGDEVERSMGDTHPRGECELMDAGGTVCHCACRAALNASEREVERLKSLQPGDTWRSCGHIAPGTCWTCYVARGQALATAEARLAEVEKDLREDVAALMRAKVQLEENVVLLSEAKEELEREDSDGRALVAALTRAHCCATLEDDGTCGGCPVSAALAPRPMSGQPAEKEPQP